MTIYDRITKCLDEREKSRAEMCKSTGISYSTLGSLFQRKSKSMSLDFVKKIAEYLGVSVDYLVLGHDFQSFKVNEPYNETDVYSRDQLDFEIIRVSRTLGIKNKTKLLSFAYELESSESK